MQDEYEPVIRSHRLKQLLAKRSSNPQINPHSNDTYSEMFETSRTVQPNLCDMSASHKVNSANSSYRPLPNLPSSSPQATDRNYLAEELPRRIMEVGNYERQSDKENITTRNQTRAISKMLEKENNTTDMNPVTTSSMITRPNATSMMTFEDRESTRWETVDNRPVPGDTTRRSSLGVIESNLSSYTTTSRYPEITNRDFDNKSQRSSLAKNLVQPNPSPRHFLRESEPKFMFSADRVSQRASDVSGEFLASPAMSEEDLYKSSPFLMYSEVNKSPRLMASERTGAQMLASQSQRVVEGIMCPEHHDSVITYICLQDKCGRLLCPTCAQEHRRKNHQGVYETLQNFKRNVNSQLIQAKASLVTNANQIAHLQFDMDKSGSGLGEKIDKLEESLINGIKQYCDNLRKEYSKDVSFDSGKFNQSLTALHEGISGMVEKLDDDLQSLLACKDNSVLSAQFLSKMVMESYMSCSDEFKSAVAEVNNKVRLFMENQGRPSHKSSDNMSLQADNDITSKLKEFLMRNVKLVKTQQPISKDSVSPRRTSKEVVKPKPNIPRNFESKKVTRDVKEVGNKKISEPKPVYLPQGLKAVEQNRRASSLNPKKSRSLSMVQEPEPFEYEEEEQQQQQQYQSQYQYQYPQQVENKVQKTITPKWRGREEDKDLVSLLWEPQEDIEEQMHTFSARHKEVNSNGIDSYPMRLMVKHMAKVYNSEKIKVIDDGFFEGLYDFQECVTLADFRKRELSFENVKQYMQITSGRGGRCLFSAYEKIFFLLNLDNKEWVLIEVRKSPKSIIIYDFLGRLSRTELIQNIFDTIFRVIKFEYKTRLGQNVESHMWDRKIALEPCLSLRDPDDTGILVLKMIANEYKNKPVLQGSISPEEIGETRKMLEAIFVALEGNDQEN